ncbi:hypothetical protein GCM10010327_18170 [Streptomyces nitrosporeus]|nr:hypothetical protein GCM10010327_18170 [Streptomyces nitrosporeus]
METDRPGPDDEMVAHHGPDSSDAKSEGSEIRRLHRLPGHLSVGGPEQPAGTCPADLGRGCGGRAGHRGSSGRWGPEPVSAEGVTDPGGGPGPVADLPGTAVRSGKRRMTSVVKFSVDTMKQVRPDAVSPSGAVATSCQPMAERT